MLQPGFSGSAEITGGFGTITGEITADLSGVLVEGSTGPEVDATAVVGFGAAIGTGVSIDDLTATLDPELRRQSLVSFLLTLLRAWASERPLILMLEDAHWLDSLSWELAVQAARSLKIEETHGTLEPGKVADLAVFDVPDRNRILYHFGVNHCLTVVKGGEVVVRDGRPEPPH